MKHQVLAEVNAAVERVRSGLQVGFHIEHVNSFNPIFRETQRALAGVQGECKVYPGNATR